MVWDCLFHFFRRETTSLPFKAHHGFSHILGSIMAPYSVLLELEPANLPMFAFCNHPAKSIGAVSPQTGKVAFNSYHNMPNSLP